MQKLHEVAKWGNEGTVPSVPAFLKADWKDLAMLNYAIEPSILAPLVPAGTELDTWNGTTYVSVVGFLFENTLVSGIPIPFHRNFEEVNLRFYVRRETREGLRRGVVFIKEIVPRRLIAIAARRRSLCATTGDSTGDKMRNSLPNTTGDTTGNAMDPHSNTISNIRDGAYPMFQKPRC